MTPLFDSPRPSSSKPTLLASLRRSLINKPKRESETEHFGEYVPKPRAISSLTTSNTPSLPRTPVPSSGRIRMSGSRLPSGYKSTAITKSTPTIVSPAPKLPPSKPELSPPAPPPQLRRRLARLFPTHSAPASPTPSSSTYSFPSSSSGASESTCTSASTPTANRRQVRFSPSTSLTRTGERRAKSLDVPAVLQEKPKVRMWGKQ